MNTLYFRAMSPTCCDVSPLISLTPRSRFSLFFMRALKPRWTEPLLNALNVNTTRYVKFNPRWVPPNTCFRTAVFAGERGTGGRVPVLGNRRCLAR